MLATRGLKGGMLATTEWLSSLKKGDLVVIDDNWGGESLGTVTRCTKTMIITSSTIERRWNRRTGFEVGASHSRSILRKPTEKSITKIRHAAKVKRILGRFREVDSSNVAEVAMVDEIVKLLDAEHADSKAVPE